MITLVDVASRERIMPLDYGAYLLSSSPPALTASHFYGGHFRNSLNLYSFAASPTPTIVQSGRSDAGAAQLRGRKGPTNLKPIISPPKPADTSSEEETSSEPTSPDSTNRIASPEICENDTRNKPKKRVSFADHKGKQLEEVRFMTESSDTPPKLRPEVLAALRTGTTAVPASPPLELCFPQPASDYVKFRQKVNTNCVSLENVILKDYTIIGTVKVKNVSFEKEVFVRYTHNSWSTSHDAMATYVHTGSAATGSKNVFDSFSFKLTLPANTNTSENIEFCVCYRHSGGEHWDNNEGRNYKVAQTDWDSLAYNEDKIKPQSITELSNVSLWTGVAAWDYVDTSTPYW